MAERRYFIRFRGRVTGPHGLADLQRMARLGTFSRVHEVSIDGSVWQAAGSFPELFAQPSPRQARGPSPVAPQSARVQPGPGGQAHRGPVEPVAQAEPASQAHSGPLELAPIEPVATPRPSGPVVRSRPGGLAAALPSGGVAGFLRQVKRLGVVDSYCVAVLLLFCANVPHTRVQGRLSWWWDLPGGTGAWPLVVFAVFSLLAAVGLPLAAGFVQGRARGWTFVSSAAAGLLLLVLAAACGPRASGALAAAVLPAASLVLLIGIIVSRSAAQRPEAGRALHAAAGGASCIAAVLAAAFGIGSLAGVRHGGGVPAWAVTGAVLAGLGWLAGLAGGAASLAAGWVAPSARATRASVMALLASLALLAVAAAIGGYGSTVLFAGEDEGARFLLSQVLRLVVATYALSTLLAIGAADILAGSWLRPQQNDRPLDPGGR